MACYAYRYPAWPATLSANIERRQLDCLWRGMSRGVYLSDGGEAYDGVGGRSAAKIHADNTPQVASVQSSVAQSRENVSSVSDVSSLALSQDRAASRASFEALAPA